MHTSNKKWKLKFKFEPFLWSIPKEKNKSFYINLFLYGIVIITISSSRVSVNCIGPLFFLVKKNFNFFLFSK